MTLICPKQVEKWNGYVFSHVSGSYILGFKGLFLSFFDGSSFFPWDMSVHVAKKEIKIVLVKNVKMNALKVKWI